MASEMVRKHFILRKELADDSSAWPARESKAKCRNHHPGLFAPERGCRLLPKRRRLLDRGRPSEWATARRLASGSRICAPKAGIGRLQIRS